MPQVIIQADTPGGEAAEITLNERVVASNFESRHYAAQPDGAPQLGDG